MKQLAKTRKGILPNIKRETRSLVKSRMIVGVSLENYVTNLQCLFLYCPAKTAINDGNSIIIS